MWRIASSLCVSHQERYLDVALGRLFPKPNSSPAWLARVCALAVSGQPQAAALLAQDVAKVCCGDARILLCCAELLQEQGREEVHEQLRLTEKALGLGLPLGLKKAAHLQLALALERKSRQSGSDLGPAIREVEAALEADPSDCMALYQLARLKALACAPAEDIVALGQRALQAGGLSLGPAWAVIAVARASQQQHEKAIAAIDAGLAECGPGAASLLLSLKVQVLLAGDEPAKALEALQQLMAHVQRGTANPEAADSDMSARLSAAEADMWAQGVHVFLALGQRTDAQFCVDRALSLRPLGADSHYVAGLVHEERGDLQAAIAAFEQAISLDSDHADAQMHLGAMHHRRGAAGDYVVARSLLVSGLKHRPNSSFGWYYLGLVNRAEDRLEEAEEHLKTAVSLQSVVPGLPYMLPHTLF